MRSTTTVRSLCAMTAPFHTALTTIHPLNAMHSIGNAYLNETLERRFRCQFLIALPCLRSTSCCSSQSAKR